MIEEQAVVVSVEGERAHLEIERSSPCGLCGATRGCGVSLWGRLFSRSRGSISAANALQAKVGEHVIIGVQEGALLAGSIAAYLLPLILICAGGLFGAMFATSRATGDLYAVAGAITGLIAGLAWLRFHTGSRQQDGRYQPVMLRRAESISIRHCSR
ncbi:MAG TPA: SoxR reducing system RseC family protein [Novimethylophilus sp.]|jgi:sigma-E factor negative regulatory protein RseC|uniref:SoxR reducing system RseC family protein n=1 Tax=Novimethylophilus sp. TaxID=2137426 RepID=UPI002F40ACEA